MLKKVRVEDSGDTGLFTASLVDMYEFEEVNEKAIAEGKRPATGKRVLLGITKASCNQRKSRFIDGIKRKCYHW